MKWLATEVVGVAVTVGEVAVEVEATTTRIAHPWEVADGGKK